MFHCHCDLREAANAGQTGLWDIDERYLRLSEADDPQEKLSRGVWEVFRRLLGKALKRSDGANGSRPPYDPVMLKIMVMRALV